MIRSLGWLGDIVAQHAYHNGVPLPQRRRWDFVGSQWSITDDPETGVLSIDITLTFDTVTLAPQTETPPTPTEGGLIWATDEDSIVLTTANANWVFGAVSIDETSVPAIINPATEDDPSLAISVGGVLYLNADSVVLADGGAPYAAFAHVGALQILSAGGDGIDLYPGADVSQALELTANAGELTGLVAGDLRLETGTGSIAIDAADDLAIDAASDIDITAVATCDLRGAVTSVIGSDASIVVDSAITATCTDDFAVTATGAIVLTGASAQLIMGTADFVLASDGTITQGQASSGAGRVTDWSTELGQTPGTHKAGDWLVNLGAPVSGVTAQGGFRKADGTKLLTCREIGGPSTHLAFGDAAGVSYRAGVINATSLNFEITTTGLWNAPTSITLSTPFVECTGQLSSAIHSITLAASMALNWANGNHQRPSAALNANVTFTSSNERSGAVYTVEVTQDGTGGWTVTWPANYKFNGTDGDVDTAIGAVTIWVFRADGTNVRCTSTKRYTA